MNPFNQLTRPWEKAAGIILVLATIFFIKADSQIAGQNLWPFTITAAVCGLTVFAMRVWRSRRPTTC